MSTVVGRRIRKRRLALGLSQRELAGKRLSASYISLLENGARRPSAKVIHELATRLECSPQWLETGRHNRNGGEPKASKASTIGERIGQRRRELGLNQRDLVCAGLRLPYITFLETGRRKPSVKAIRKLAARLECSPHWLETGEPDPAEHLARLVLEHKNRPLPKKASRLAAKLVNQRR